jgi:hypothetical protein
MKAHEVWGREVIAPSILTSELDGAALLPGKETLVPNG